jgi:hypothetical protein
MDIDNIRHARAASMTVEALMFSLRERGVAALKEGPTRRRLAELSDDQVVEAEKRCRQFKFGRGPWTEAEIETLVRLREELRE